MKQTLLEAAYETVKGLHRAGLVDVVTMREFDADCLPEVKELSPGQIQRIRRAAKVSQAVFAKLLNTTLSTIRQWERGDKHPRGTSLKLLHLVRDKGASILC